MNCPYCKSEIIEGATRCAACTSWLETRPPVSEWTRAREGKMIAGVCRGLADRYRIPVAALRLAFVLSVLFGGWGIIAYVVLWVIMPYGSSLPAAHQELAPPSDLPRAEAPTSTQLPSGATSDKSPPGR